MLDIGTTAKDLREAIGWTQRFTAKKLGVSDVHLCNVEKGNTKPSQALLDRYQDLWGIDLYVYAWCRQGDVDALPLGVRAAASNLETAWRKRIDDLIQKHRKGVALECSTSDK